MHGTNERFPVDTPSMLAVCPLSCSGNPGVKGYNIDSDDSDRGGALVHGHGTNVQYIYCVCMAILYVCVERFLQGGGNRNNLGRPLEITIHNA
jgi:hypothetical protein